LPSSWSRQLSQELTSLVRPSSTTAAQSKVLPRAAFVGIGNEFNADDCAGPFIARKLAARLIPRENVLVLDAGTAPENITGTLRKFKPDLVVLIDAVDMGQAVGSIAWLSWDEMEGMDAFTHGLPPAVLGAYLRQELDCRVGLIGIQPASLIFDQPPDPQVRVGINIVVRKVRSVLGRIAV